MKIIGAIVTVLSMVITTHAAVQATKVKIKKSDISEILQKNSETNTLLVRTKDGRKFSLKLSTAQIEDIENSLNFANTNNTVALQAAASATAPAPAATAGTTNVKAEDVAPEKTSPWGIGYTNWTLGNIQKFSEGEDTVIMRHLPSISYKLDSGLKLSFHPNFQMKYFQANGGTEHDLMALQFRASKGGFTLPADISLFMQGRYYLPTGESLKNSESLGILRLNAIFNKQVTPVVGLEYYASPRYYLNSVASTIEEDDFGRFIGEGSANTGFRYFHSFKVSQKLNETFKTYQDIFLDHKWKLEDPEVNVEGGLQTFFGWDLGVEIAALEWLSFDVSIGQYHDTSGTKEFSFFDGEELGYSIFTSFKIL